jgi:hypothetical protein
VGVGSLAGRDLQRHQQYQDAEQPWQDDVST